MSATSVQRLGTFVAVAVAAALTHWLAFTTIPFEVDQVADVLNVIGSGKPAMLYGVNVCTLAKLELLDVWLIKYVMREAPWSASALKYKPLPPKVPLKSADIGSRGLMPIGVAVAEKAMEVSPAPTLALCVIEAVP